MANFFLVLTMASLVLFIIGLINPSLVIFHWKKRRFLVVFIYGTITLVSLLFLIMTSPVSHNQVGSLASPLIPTEDQTSESSPTPPPTTDLAIDSVKLFRNKETYTDQFSQLTVTLITRYDGILEITGETDLPNGSILGVLFRQLATPAHPHLFDLQTEVLVTNGSFQISLQPPEGQQFYQGPYQIRVYFSPQKQIPQIRALVGNKGEKLSGLKSRIEGQTRILEDIKELSFEFKINTPMFP